MGMSRTSIVLLLLLTLAAAGAATAWLVFPRVSEAQRDEAAMGLRTAARLLEEMERADRWQLVGKLEQLAGRPGLVQLLAEGPGNDRESWLVRLRAELAGLTAAAREVAAVDDFFVLDRSGRGLVRNVDLHWTGEAPSEHPAVRAAIDGARDDQSRVVLFERRDDLARGVVVPIMRRGRRVGMLFGVFPLDHALAKARGADLPEQVHFAYLSRNGWAASNLPQVQREALQQHFAANPALRRRLLAGGRFEPRVFEAGSVRLQALGRAFGSDEVPVGLVVVRSTARLQRSLDELSLYLVGGIGVLFVFVTMMVVLFGGRLTRSLRDLERQLQKAVSTEGDVELRKRGPAVVRRLAGLVEQLIRGRAAPTAPVAAPAAQEPPGDEDAALGEDDGLAVVQETIEIVGPEVDRGEPMRQLFERFRRAKHEAGESTERLDFERFQSKLLRQAESLRDRHGCARVDFEVRIKAGRVNLVPRITP
jgi:hypothetical protein